MATVPGAPAPPEQAPAAVGPVGRMIGVFFSPKTTFEDIAKKPSWVAPVVLLTILSILVSIGIHQRIDWREFMSQQLDKDPRAAQMSAEQKQQRIEAGAKITSVVTYLFGVAGPILFILVIAGVMMGAYNLLAGANATFRQSLAVAAHAAMTGAVSSVLFLLILYLKPFGTVDLENPVATNAGAFLPEGSAKWLVTLAKQMDIFTIWTLILLAIGFAAINPKKLKGGKAFSMAFGVWAVWVLIRTGIAFIFS